MLNQRKKPSIFNVDETIKIKQTSFILLLGLCFSIVFFFLLRTDYIGMPVAPWYSWIPQALCLTLTCIIQPVIMIFAGIKGFVDIFSIRNQKKEWIENAVPVQVSIVDREEAYDDYVADWDYKLKIRFPPEIITEPDEQIIWAGVSAEIYKRYSGQHKARIYYSAAKPGQFILDGEQYS